jgi:hypothetical protein
MTSELSFLDRVSIARPCSATLEEMAPVDGDRVKYCDHCHLNVHNLSAMTRSQAETFLRDNTGKLCIAYLAAQDGGVVTRSGTAAPYVHAVRRERVSRQARMMTLAALLTCVLMGPSAHAATKGQKSAAAKSPVAKSPATKPDKKSLMTVGHRAYRVGRVVMPRNGAKAVQQPPKSDEAPQKKTTSARPDDAARYDTKGWTVGVKY